MANYWIVGANWSGDNLQEAFYRRGYWEMGYSDAEKPRFAEKRESIIVGDRIAVKSMDGRGKSTITIHAIGIVKEVADKKVYVNWLLTDMDRQVHSNGAYSTIHGPYQFNEAWTKEVFCI
jgi:hypothetical protein